MDSHSIFIALYIVAFIYSVVLHEVAHAWVARQAGDHTAEAAGRISLNPIKHIDPIMTILVPIISYMTAGFAFGGAKPVPVNPYNFRNLEWDDVKVSLAGVTVNFAIALACGYSLHLWTPGTINYALFAAVADLNIVLGVFNLMPIPPLDGSHIMRLILSKIDPGIAETYERIGMFGLMIIVLMMNFLSAPIRIVHNFMWEHVFRI